MSRIGKGLDYLSLYWKKGLTWKEYLDFDLHNQDESFRDGFLGRNEERFYLDYLNPVKYYSLARNKYLSHKVLSETGIRKAELYGCYYPEAYYENSQESSGDLQGVLKLLKQKNVQSFVMKGLESSYGNNVSVVTQLDYGQCDAVLHRFDGSTVRLSEVLGGKPLLFEEYVRQTNQFSALNPTSVNTVRFMTALYPDHSVRVFATFIKIGREGKCVDNAGSGGNVDVNVDVETGVTQYAIQFNGYRGIVDIDCHPDTKAPLNGIVIENWQLIKQDVVRFQQAFPFCKVIGWDIAITDKGPVVIELNEFWDRTGQLFIRRGWREEVRDCYLAWKSTGAAYPLQRQPNRLSEKHLEYIVSR